MQNPNPKTIHEEPIKRVSPYRLTRQGQENLAASIEGEDWDKAIKDLIFFEQAVSMATCKTGKDTNKLHELFFELSNLLKNPFSLWGHAPNTYMKKKSCREALQKIVNKLSDYGIFMGQQISLEGKTQEELLDILKYLNHNIDAISVRFCEQDASKEETLGALKQLLDGVSKYSVKEKELTTLKMHLLEKITTTIGEMNSVNLETPGKLTFKNFAVASAEMQHALNNFLIAIDNPLYRIQLLEEMKLKHVKKKSEEDDGTDYPQLLKENTELRNAIKEIVSEVLEEEGNNLS
ncbi:MAG: hypothetical protein U9O96_08320 [Candidatus Thermoplasmatota archaeon]|nr:hypothetical protein [Candidatus Thermoplasmatota archaeon]